jgi:hypothetical protein
VTTAQDNGRETAAEQAAIAAAHHSATDHPEVQTVELANRIILRVHPVASHLIREAARRVPEPAVPRHWVESRGKDRDDPNDPGWEENPDSPTYKRAYAEWAITSDLAAYKVALILGTRIEHIPEGLDRPESDTWIEDIRAAAAAAGIEPPEVRTEPPQARYLDWLRFYAIPSEDDIFRLSKLITSGSFVTEEALADSLDTFRGGKAWAADLAASLVADRPDRDHVPPDDAGDGS